jgi:hypothetical protein
MAKMFISYKYSDSDVPQFQPGAFNALTTVRNYVDVLQTHLDANDHVNKGEKDDESLASFKNEIIESKLRAKIFDSTVTIVVISKNMKDVRLREDDQWIPWEIAYSLKEMTKNERTSGTNAVIAVVLPDRNGSYDYFIQENTCANCHSRTLRTDTLFEVLKKNMFNRKVPKRINCSNHPSWDAPHIGDDHSYIYPVKWGDFIGDVNGHIGVAVRLSENLDDFELVKIV